MGTANSRKNDVVLLRVSRVSDPGQLESHLVASELKAEYHSARKQNE